MIDTFANCIVGWKASRSAKTDFVLDALEQALYARRPPHRSGLIHHSERGGQYVSIRYTERLGKAGAHSTEGGHRFHAIVGTRSTASWAAIPCEGGQLGLTDGFMESGLG